MRSLMALNKQMKWISKQNTPLICGAAQVQQLYHETTCKYLGQHSYCLAI